MFTVIIPIYNKVNYVEKAVKSVLRQTYSDFELVIVNDGSSDGSFEKVSSFRDRRLKIINQANDGVSSARNNGAKNANFDYLAFLDADDWWDENFLKEMKELVTKFPEAGMYGSNYYIVKYGLSYPAQIGLPVDFEVGYIDYFKVYSQTFWVPLNCSFVVVKKSVFLAENGFKSSLKFGEDLDLWIRIALNHKVGYVNKFLAYSNQDVESGSRALGPGKYWKKSEHIIFNLDFLSENEQQNSALKSLLDGLRIRSLVQFYVESRYEDEIRKIVKKVDIKRQPFLYRFIYRWPKGIVIAYLRTKQLGSFLKQRLLRNR